MKASKICVLLCFFSYFNNKKLTKVMKTKQDKFIRK